MLEWIALGSLMAVAHPQPAGPPVEVPPQQIAAIFAPELDLPQPHRFRIQLDYRFDVDGYFDDPVVRANLEAAAEVWSQHLSDDLPTVPAGTPLLVINPHTMEEERVVLDYDIDDLVVFVASTHVVEGMARAGPITRWYRRLDSEYPADAQQRIHGPDFQPWAGFLAVNPESVIPLVADESPESDDDVPLNSRRRYDLMTLVLHELGHVLGIGTSPAFRAHSGLLPSYGPSTQNTTDGRFLIVWSAYSVFYGPSARRVNGGEPVRLSEDMGHIATRFTVDGQQDLMDQDLNIVRQLPTNLDLALLVDIGFQVDGQPPR